MLYSEEFIASLQGDPVLGTIELCDRLFTELNKSGSEGWSEAKVAALLEAYALLVEVIEAGLLPMDLDYPKVSGSLNNAECQSLIGYFRHVEQVCKGQEIKMRVDSMRSRFRAGLGRSFAYEFSQGDLERIQELVNQLRDNIAQSKGLEREHQQRLLRRLERLQAELHKKVSDLDRFWGLVGDAGVALGKLGTDAKPIVDRIREIAEIVWRTQSRAEELPSGTKLPQLADRSDSDGA